MSLSRRARVCRCRCAARYVLTFVRTATFLQNLARSHVRDSDLRAHEIYYPPDYPISGRPDRIIRDNRIIRRIINQIFLLCMRPVGTRPRAKRPRAQKNRVARTGASSIFPVCHLAGAVEYFSDAKQRRKLRSKNRLRRAVKHPSDAARRLLANVCRPPRRVAQENCPERPPVLQNVVHLSQLGEGGRHGRSRVR